MAQPAPPTRPMVANRISGSADEGPPDAARGKYGALIVACAVRYRAVYLVTLDGERCWLSRVPRSDTARVSELCCSRPMPPERGAFSSAFHPRLPRAARGAANAYPNAYPRPVTRRTSRHASDFPSA
jgi:hypothetical protein